MFFCLKLLLVVQVEWRLLRKLLICYPFGLLQEVFFLSCSCFGLFWGNS